MLRTRGRSVIAVVIVAVLATLTVPVSADEMDGPEEQVVVLLEDADDAADVADDTGADPAHSSPTVADAPPTMVVEAGPDVQANLRADPRVRAVLTRGIAVEPSLAQSVAHIGAPTQWTAGETGIGQTIAVIDTGVASSFGGALAGQACFVGGPQPDDGRCGPGQDRFEAFDDVCFDAGVCEETVDALDPEAARPCAQPSIDCRHGSAVAAIAARNTSPYGVAPGSTVYAIQTHNPSTGEMDLVDIYLGLVHVVELHDAGAFDFAAVNLSLGTVETFAATCDGAGGVDGAPQFFHEVFAALRTRGITPIVSAGNEHQRNRLSFPACLSNAVAVGATDLLDRVPSFSNLAPGRTILAPGFGIDVPSIPGDPSWTGTSFSAPHAAGVIALLAGERPAASVSELTMCLISDGVHVTVGGIRYPRIGSTCRNTTYIHAVHQLFVQRDARSSEVGRWLESVQNNSFLTMTQTLSSSDEWAGSRLRELYNRLLNRQPDPIGFRNWMTKIRTGTTLEHIAIGIFGSQEYYGKAGGTPRTFVTALYRDILGRGPDANSATWVSKIRSGIPRHVVAAGFYGSQESIRQRITRLYLEILQRRPDPTGMRTWSLQLNHLGDVRLAAVLAASREYFGRVSRR